VATAPAPARAFPQVARAMARKRALSIVFGAIGLNPAVAGGGAGPARVSQPPAIVRSSGARRRVGIVPDRAGEDGTT